jgi:hypothetical protein
MKKEQFFQAESLILIQPNGNALGYKNHDSQSNSKESEFLHYINACFENSIILYTFAV